MVNDRLFDVPGQWNVRQCTNPDCGLLWLDPRPVEDDIGKLYRNYFTHLAAFSFPVRKRMGSFRKSLKNAIMAYAFGYRELAPIGWASAIGWVLARIRLLRDRIGRSIL